MHLRYYRDSRYAQVPWLIAILQIYTVTAVLNQALCQDTHLDYGLLQLFGTLVVSLGSELLQLAKPWARQQCFELKETSTFRAQVSEPLQLLWSPQYLLKFKFSDREGREGTKFEKENLPLRFHIYYIKSSSDQLGFTKLCYWYTKCLDKHLPGPFYMFLVYTFQAKVYYHYACISDWPTNSIGYIRSMLKCILPH